MAIRTLNQIVGEFKEIADQHRQINNFTVGTIEDFATSGTTNYPAWWVSYQNNGFEDRRENFSFSFWVVDRVKKDRSNLIEIHSDMKQIAMDIISQLNDSAYKWSIDSNITLSAIYEPFHEDEIAGWTFDVTISQAFTKDVCQIPFIASPTIGRSQSGYNPNTPVYQYVPTTRRITINGVTYDLSQDRVWNVTASGATNFVPYTGAIQNVDLGSYGLNADYISFNLNPTSSIGAGKIVYDGGTGALSYYLNNSSVTSYIGETQHAYVHNAEAVQINKGQAVYLYQSSGNKASVKLAYNTSDATSAKTFGLAAENIGAGKNGIVICQGRLQGVNTGMYNEGDSLYLGTTAGSLTAVKPYAPNHMVFIGVVEKASNGNGQIYVRVSNGFEIEELHNVDAQNPTNDDIIVYSSGTTLWTKKNIYTAIGAASTSSNGYLTSTDWNTFNNKASQDTFVLQFYHGSLLNPVDNTTYYFSYSGNTIATTDTNVDISLGIAFKVISIQLLLHSSTTSGSAENVNLKFRNTTTATSTTIGTYQTNLVSSTVSINYTFTGLNISVGANDSFCLQFDTPTYATNPVSLGTRANIICQRT
jgi:hypothetical protein